MKNPTTRWKSGFGMVVNVSLAEEKNRMLLFAMNAERRFTPMLKGKIMKNYDFRITTDTQTITGSCGIGFAHVSGVVFVNLRLFGLFRINLSIVTLSQTFLRAV